MALRNFFVLLCLGVLAPGWARAAEVSLGQGPEPTAIQPNPLAGLWSLSLGGDFAVSETKDLQSFYPAGTLSPPAQRLAPGFYLLGRKHVTDGFYAAAGLSSLPKGYTVDGAGGQDLYQWDALLLSTGGGWMIYRALNFSLFTQAEVGWLTLSQGSFERSPSAGSGQATHGLFEGSAIATQFSGGGLWFIMPSVALELAGGYRFARMPLNFTAGAGQPQPAFPPNFFADFSGPYARAGLDFFWGLRNPWAPEEAPPPPKEGPPGTE